MTDLVGLLARLVAVFALLAVVLWLLKRTGGLQRRDTPLQVLSTTRLGKSATLSVVRVHGEEYVLGVSGSGVTVVTSRPADGPEPAPAPAADPAAAPPAGTAPTGTPPTGAPPTAAEFLRSGWQVLRRRSVSATELSDEAVAAAVAAALAAPPAPAAAPAGGEVPQPRTSPDFAADLAAALKVSGSAADAEVVPEPALGTPGDAPSPTAADGSAARAARRDAGPREESTWTAHRPPVRTAVRVRARA